jgi:hypothetical protein
MYAYIGPKRERRATNLDPAVMASTLSEAGTARNDPGRNVLVDERVRQQLEDKCAGRESTVHPIANVRLVSR